MITDAFVEAGRLLIRFDAELMEILALSMQVSTLSLLISVVIGLPVGAVLAISRFPGRRVAITVLNALMGLPPVVVGLLVYLMLSRSGPLGVLGLLYTPTAMVIAQVVLITPIIGALSCQVIEDLHLEYDAQFQSLSVPRTAAVLAYLWDARYSLITAVLAGFGRAISEVGAVIIVGGNIDHLTRVMTTAIALETSKGELAIALALGIILLSIALIVNAVVMMLKTQAKRMAYV
ncbi:MAG: ABC transporter permease subunit [Gammaproteobacteria bacterium]|nr:ABC transporter permease subunit [Gammaproteobacteria bacterium]